MNTPCWSAWWYKKLLVKCKCTNIAWKWHIIGIMSQIASAPKERSPKCTMLHWPVALQVPGRISGSNFPPRSQSWTFSVILYIATGLGYIGSHYEVCTHANTVSHTHRHARSCTQVVTHTHTHTQSHCHPLPYTHHTEPFSKRKSPHMQTHIHTPFSPHPYHPRHIISVTYVYVYILLQGFLAFWWWCFYNKPYLMGKKVPLLSLNWTASKACMCENGSLH